MESNVQLEQAKTLFENHPGYFLNQKEIKLSQDQRFELVKTTKYMGFVIDHMNELDLSEDQRFDLANIFLERDFFLVSKHIESFSLSKEHVKQVADKAFRINLYAFKQFRGLWGFSEKEMSEYWQL
jgi:hypothetical protein